MRSFVPVIAFVCFAAGAAAQAPQPQRAQPTGQQPRRRCITSTS